MFSQQNLVEKLIYEIQKNADCCCGSSIHSLIILIHLQSLQNVGFSSSYGPKS